MNNKHSSEEVSNLIKQIDKFKKDVIIWLFILSVANVIAVILMVVYFAS